MTTKERACTCNPSDITPPCERQYVLDACLKARRYRILEQIARKEESALGGLKYDSDKPRLDLLDPYAIEQLAHVLTFGAAKYEAHNWRRGITTSRLIAALLRHVFAYLRGEDRDAETKLSHIAHAMCCCMFILGLQHRTECDDRWKSPVPPEV